MIELRPLEAADLEFLLEVRNHPSTRSYLHDDRVFSLRDARRWFTETEPRWFVIVAEGKQVGTVRTSDPDPRARSVMVGADIHMAHRGKGYATLALRKLFQLLRDEGFGRASLEVLANNVPAIRLYERLGFQREGRRAGAVRRNGQSLDSLIMSRRLEAEPIPDKLVVMTFDDGNRTDFELAAPLLKEHGFGATFFISEGLGFIDDKRKYMTWREIRSLHEQGFEIGNHTASHAPVTRAGLRQDLEKLEQSCLRAGVPAPVTFCFPGWSHSLEAVEILRGRNYRFARRGMMPELSEADEGGQTIGLAYDPERDHPLLVPTTWVGTPSADLQGFAGAIERARDGRAAVLAFHGIPDEHHWVSTEPTLFRACVQMLHEGGYRVVSLRALSRHVDLAARLGADPYAEIHARVERLDALRQEARRNGGDAQSLSFRARAIRLLQGGSANARCGRPP